MIDMHCHILHGIDDGSDSLEESVGLCRLAVDNDISTVVLTPHLPNPSQLEDFLRRRARRMEELKRALDQRKIELELLPGAEVFVDDDVFFAPSLDGATLNGSRYINVGHAQHNIALVKSLYHRNKLIYKGFRLGRGHIHFPVSCYNRFSHFVPSFILFIKQAGYARKVLALKEFKRCAAAG